MHIRPIQINPSSRFPELISDYLAESESLSEFVTAFPSESNLLDFAKSRPYDDSQRSTLCEVLTSQYAQSTMTDKTRQNIELLSSSNSRTITTGHQLNLLSGPFFMISKISNVITLCQRLNQKSDLDFVPVFWMATEDHDFAEINHTYLHGNKVSWESNQQGAVGRFNLDGIKNAIQEAQEILGEKFTEQSIWSKITEAYRSSTLAEATRSLINSLFGDFGLVIIDGDDHDLKALFSKEIDKELSHQQAHKEIEKSIAKLSAGGYKIQANPRSINGFFLEDNRRDRLDYSNAKLKVIGREDISHETIQSEVSNYPEKFSPNAVFRPLYQERILPNVAYVGGGGEISYWLELKAMFEAYELPFPILLVRSSAWVINRTIQKKLTSLSLNFEDFLGDTDALIAAHVRDQSKLDLQKELEEIRSVFDSIDKKAKEVEESVSRSVATEKAKVEKAIFQLEKKLISKLKSEHETDINKIKAVQSKLFPQGRPQERTENVFALSGDPEVLVAQMIESCDPLENQFYLIEPHG